MFHNFFTYFKIACFKNKIQYKYQCTKTIVNRSHNVRSVTELSLNYHLTEFNNIYIANQT